MRTKIAIIIALVLLTTSIARAAAPASRPTQMVEQEGCVTAECHAAIKAYKKVHGPVSVNACDACQGVVDPAVPAFALPGKGAEQWVYSHEFEVSKSPVIQKP